MDTPASEQKYEPVDLDRGVAMQRADEKSQYVCMYVDSPGEYFNEAGTPLPEAAAAAAGFDVNHEAGEKWHAEQMAAYEEKLRAESDRKMEEFHQESLGGQSAHEPELTSTHSHPKVGDYFVDSPLVTLKDKKGDPRETEFHGMRARGGGRWNVVHKDTGIIAGPNLKKEEAIDFMIREADRLQSESQAEG